MPTEQDGTAAFVQAVLADNQRLREENDGLSRSVVSLNADMKKAEALALQDLYWIVQAAGGRVDIPGRLAYDVRRLVVEREYDSPLLRSVRLVEPEEMVHPDDVAFTPKANREAP